MKTNRLQFEYRTNASALHKKVGNLIRDGETFVGVHEAYQEYPVSRVNPSYENNSHHFDWVIPHLKVIIECHGKQHFTPTAFDGNYEAAVANFEELKGRDKAKKNAALDAGFIYIMVPYSATAILTAKWLNDAYTSGQTELERYNREHEEERKLVEEKQQEEITARLAEEKKAKDKETRRRYLESEQHRKELRLARESRHRQYRRLKELKRK